MSDVKANAKNNVEHFIDIGITLPTEKNHHALLDKILRTLWS